jgi:hypothetical protein
MEGEYRYESHVLGHCLLWWEATDVTFPLVCCLHGSITSTNLANLILAVMVYKVSSTYGMLIWDITRKKTIRFNPYKPLFQQVDLSTLAIMFAVAKWYYTRDNGRHMQKGK